MPERIFDALEMILSDVDAAADSAKNSPDPKDYPGLSRAADIIHSRLATMRAGTSVRRTAKDAPTLNGFPWRVDVLIDREWVHLCSVSKRFDAESIAAFLSDIPSVGNVSIRQVEAKNPEHFRDKGNHLHQVVVGSRVLATENSSFTAALILSDIRRVFPDLELKVGVLNV